MASFRQTEQCKHVNRDEKPVSFSNYAPFVRFHVSLGRICQKTAAAMAKKSPNDTSECRAWSANLLRPTNEGTCHLYLHFFFYRLLWNKVLGAYESCTGYLLQDVWEPNKPGWTPLSCRAPVFYKNATSSCALHHNTPTPPLPTARVLSSRDSLLILSQLLCPGLFPSCAGDSWVPTGHDCCHRWESGPAMASICRVGPVRFCDAFLWIPHLFFSVFVVGGESRVPLKVGRGQTRCPLIRFSGK